ncbi:Trp biosynthesis-associated membrane protein [Actinomycetospora sp. TBRC 11914]|uniref:Trp biosynthesis-associated membrane protein n=1 Tax=Actinomycetospora sp. TBRC 11914 TaxID=2729387 RepID=UPI00145CD9BD|nr:Trp biosynthesis-associated membrane protein [Actinomycetospora sp. TBRC 11914]NMO89601.1 Trp biosynthesis-associated membrane protein [Actinomycetospora sp. TBRC 11914]
MSGPAAAERAPRRPGSRLLGLAVVGLVLAAASLWGASRGTWLTATWDVPLRGRVVATAVGADTEPVLVPWALLALAAIGGLFATSGWGRRAVGVVVGVAGLWALLRAVSGLAAPAPSQLPASAQQAGRALGVQVTLAWPLLAALGAVLLLAVGVLVAVRGSVMPRLGARYDAPGARPRDRPADDERGLWEALDAGEDPTAAPRADEPSAEGPDAGREGPRGPAAGRAPDRAEGGRG